MTLKAVHVIGGGLAGSEAAWQLAQAGVPVVLHEMRPLRATAAHKTDGYAELVCSNSFRSDDKDHNAVGLLHAEMRRLGSLVMRAADSHQVPAGGALAVDRDGFSTAVSAALAAQPLVTLVRGEVVLPPDDWDSVIIATGPLTSPDLAATIRALTGEDALAFFDAIAPIVHRDSIDLEQAWFQSRYDKAGPGGSGADYINCPLTREQYDAFIDALLAGDKTVFHDWEANTPYFDGCLPIEVMAERGRETLRHGPMKPFGLTNPRRPDVKPMRSCSCARTTSLARCSTWSASRPSSSMASRRKSSAAFPACRTRNSRGLAGCIATLSSIRPSCSMKRCGSKPIRAGALPARSPAAKAMWNPRPSAFWSAASPPPSAAMSR